ncbi:hypothetical protein [Nocardiopsis valliformis]|uniref:hypothetical protein n=1 Tax=Nocardiopsis valliformis TaxID=239974 RepID=UPI000362E804|nr:hypothetical protein [Nocardiopsis valliformis]
MTSPAKALTWAEIHRFARSPLVLPLVLVLLVSRTLSTWRDMTDWTIQSVDAATTLVLVGAGVMLAANLAVLRERRGGTADLLESLPVPAANRTWSVLCAALFCGAAAGLLVLSLHVPSLLVGASPAGVFRPQELAAGVLAVMLMGALGVALGRWVPSPVAAPVALMLIVWSLFQFRDSWLLPLVPTQAMPFEAARPPAWHLLYLAALVTAVSLAAVARHRRTAGTAVAAVAASAAVVGAATLTVVPSASEGAEPVELAGTHEGRVTVTGQASACEEHDGVDYCALPGFEPWVPLWRDAIDPVLEAAPSQAPRLEAVYQYTGYALNDLEGGGYALVGTTWGRNGGEVEYRRAVAGSVAASMAGFPPPDVLQSDGQGGFGCDAAGQARTVIALWLLSQTEAPVAAGTEREHMAEVGSDEVVVVELPASVFGAVSYGQAELDMAEELLADPNTQTLVHQEWERLVDVETTLEEAADVLGVAVPPREPSGAERGTACA